MSERERVIEDIVIEGSFRTKSIPQERAVAPLYLLRDDVLMSSLDIVKSIPLDPGIEKRLDDDVLRLRKIGYEDPGEEIANMLKEEYPWITHAEVLNSIGRTMHREYIPEDYLITEVPSEIAKNNQ